jgi:hypothetical protein
LKINLKWLGFVIGVVLLMSCQSVEKNTDSWVVKNSKGLEVLNLSQSEAIQVLDIAWKAKHEVKVKMMPQFNYELAIKKNEVITHWLYTISGFAMLKDSKKGIIYKVDLPTINAKLIK